MPPECGSKEIWSTTAPVIGLELSTSLCEASVGPTTFECWSARSRPFERAAADADTFFSQELPTLQAWSFSRDNASRIMQPPLAVIGEQSEQVSPIWRERQELLLSWLPDVEPFVLANATHLLHAANPSGMARGLADFFARHPMTF